MSEVFDNEYGSINPSAEVIVEAAVDAAFEKLSPFMKELSPPDCRGLESAVFLAFTNRFAEMRICRAIKIKNRD